ncbi:unnamed protein product (macronuclear) [Paramecium tetraurelia]|uniref:Uncharacterized protein n=1 Tax=Paramecium tetraurelia TaxID=5888 RepID=A0DSP7_PARTE|nr:uncharacterized protein GSPATT00019757001 [Paramecium tetraurelia]CAK86064.1 unnamed protein product [Paramecium tetraurelia]|eukprot:XP_001453461.1 hypothetical protein (macronuclear) [Paramecium tetraurelia strain d4-2]
MNLLFRQVVNPSNQKQQPLLQTMLHILKKWVVMNHSKNQSYSKNHLPPSLYLPDGNGNCLSIIMKSKHSYLYCPAWIYGCQEWKEQPKGKMAEYIGGYFLAFDLTEMKAHFKKQGFPWDLAKGQDNFYPNYRFNCKKQKLRIQIIFYYCI